MADQGFTEEQRRAAWVEYYKSQGYDAAQIAAAMGDSSSASSSYATTSAGNYASASGSGSNTPTARIPSGVTKQVQDTDYIAQQSAYLPGVVDEMVRTGKYKAPVGKRETVIRKGSGKVWEDTTLLDWDPKWFRLFVGDVSNDVNERTLDEAFSKYPSYCKCKVVRDRLSLKAKYGFIAFKDPEDFLKAWKENDGKYIGNRPIRLSKVKDDKYGSIAKTVVSGRKARELDKLRANHGKPLDGRPVPF